MVLRGETLRTERVLLGEKFVANSSSAVDHPAAVVASDVIQLDSRYNLTRGAFHDTFPIAVDAAA